VYSLTTASCANSSSVAKKLYCKCSLSAKRLTFFGFNPLKTCVHQNYIQNVGLYITEHKPSPLRRLFVKRCRVKQLVYIVRTVGSTYADWLTDSKELIRSSEADIFFSCCRNSPHNMKPVSLLWC
jgi:hypothetical protein